MAAARMAALRGHRVTLIETEDALGGLFRLAARAPGREECGDILNFFTTELERLKVDLCLEAPLSAALIDGIATWCGNDSERIPIGSLATATPRGQV